MKNIFMIALAALFFNATTASAMPLKETVELFVTEKGFEPISIDVKPGTSLTLNVTRKTDSTCATQIAIPSKKIKVDLPLNKTVSVKVGRLEKGEVRFACGMNMVSGVISVK